MNLEKYFPFWGGLGEEEKKNLSNAVYTRRLERGEIIYTKGDDCLGLLLVETGQLRVYTLSEEGREITLYRLFDRDICLFTASCVLNSIDFTLVVQALEQSDVMVVPAVVCRGLMHSSIAVSNYINELMASRFSDVMWILDQVMNKSFDARLAAFLIEESNLAESDSLSMTQEEIARHLGSAREVVTRMLKYFQAEGVVELFRGGLTIKDKNSLLETGRNALR